VSPNDVLNEAHPFVVDMREICQKRIRLAGARLAYLLNTTHLPTQHHVSPSSLLSLEDDQMARDASKASEGVSVRVTVIALGCTLVGMLLGWGITLGFHKRVKRAREQRRALAVLSFPKAVALGTTANRYGSLE
jgi:maleate cis-trans isomerase